MKKKNVILLNAISRALDALEEAMQVALELDVEEEEASGRGGAAPPVPPPAPSSATRPSKRPTRLALTRATAEDKTGPRLPFKDSSPPDASPPKRRSGSYAFNRFSADRMINHVKLAFVSETSEEGKRTITRTMRKLVDLGMASEDDFRGYLKKGG